MTTTTTTPKDIKRSWHHLDANDQILGRLASQAAQLLIGKHKPYFTANLDCGDYVIITNADKVRVTGGKESKKIYYRHSGFPGGLKQETLKDLQEKDSTKVIRLAVRGMLPKNKLRSSRIKRLKIFTDSNHPYADKLQKA